MRVKSLHVENLLTFDTFELDLDGGTHTIVGPNGSGKSNVVRLFDLVTKAVDASSGNAVNPFFIQAADQVLRSFAAAHHHGESPERPAVVRLEFELSRPDEKLRLASFVRAAILCTLAEEVRPGDPAIKLSLSNWVEAEVTDARLNSLFKGAIVLRHVGLAHLAWDVSYEFVHQELVYSWHLSSSGFHGIVQSTMPTAGLTAVPTVQLYVRLLGMNQMQPQPIPLPSPMPAFDLTRMLPQANEVITPIMVRIGTGTFDPLLMPFRHAIELLGLPSESIGPQRAFTLAFVLSILLNDGIFTLGEQFRGLGIGGTPPQQAGPYSWEALVSPLRSHAPWLLPMRLFELKNGNPQQRAKYRAIQEAFTDLAPGRGVDVKFQAIDLEAMNPATVGTGQTTLFPPATDGDTPRNRPGAAVTVVVDRIGDTASHPDDLPIQLHGGGTWEALVIAEALVEAEGRFVILDEPALTLHPTWQRALRSRIQNSKGTFLVITHSANLVPMDSEEHLTRLVRVENEGGATHVHRLRGLSSHDVSRVVKEFSLSTDAISLLFARGVVLLEGETELGALPKWFESCSTAGSEMRPADLDLAFYSVGGDRNFRILITVLNALQIPWVLICDGAALDVQKRAKRNPHVFEQVLSAGVEISQLREYIDSLDAEPSKRVMDETVFAYEKSLGLMHGVFTLAMGWKTADKTAETPNNESFEAFLDHVVPGRLDEADDEVGDSKVRKGLWVAEHVECPSEVNDLYENLIAALRQRGLA